MQAKRLAVIDNFFTHHDRSTLDSILADDAQIIEQGAKVRTYNKSEWVNLVTNHVIPAIPNFKWGHATDGSKDDDGYSVVTVQVILSSCLKTLGYHRRLFVSLSLAFRQQENIQGKPSAYLAQSCQR